jgi:hypothetical protein
MAADSEIRDLIAEGHPPGHRLPEWSERIRLLGDDVPSVCLDILENGDFTLRPAAIYGLRAFGYEVWSEGYWEDEHYRVRRPADEEWRVIKPKTNPQRPPWAGGT